MDFVRDCGAVTTRGRVAWVLVFAGVAMAALGLDALGAWWNLAQRLHEADLSIAYDETDLLDRFAGAYSDEPERLAFGGWATLGVAVLGAVLSVKARRLGAGVVLLAATAGSALVVGYVGYKLVLGHGGTWCGPAPLWMRWADDFVDVKQFAAALALILAATLCLWMRSREGLIAAAVCAAVMAAPALLDASTVVVVVLVTLGIALSWWFETPPPTAVLLVAVVFGALGGWASASIRHDSRSVAAFEDGHISLFGEMFEPQLYHVAARCEPVALAPMLHSDGALYLFGRGSDDEASLSKVFEEVVQARLDLHLPEKPFALNIEARRAMTVREFFIAVRALAHVTPHADFVTIVFPRRERAPIWTRPSWHDHACGLRVDLRDDGLTEADFVDFNALFEAAARGGLRVSTR